MGEIPRGRIAVTPRSLSANGHPALHRLREAGYEIVFPSPGATPTPEQLRAVIPDCVGFLAGVEPVTEDLLSVSPSLRVISRNGVGVDSIDVAAAERLGILIVNAPSANSRGVAELTIALMLASLRSIPWSDAGLKQGEWRRREGFEIEGRTLGVVGCGNIGRRVVHLALGLGMLSVGVDAYTTPELEGLEGFEYVELPELLERADVVTLHCPPASNPVIGAAELSRVAPHAHLVNTARASLVDDAEVLRALDEGRLGGFATDVFDREPPALTPLIAHPRVIVTPHVGGYTRESVDRATVDAVENLLRVLEDE